MLDNTVNAFKKTINDFKIFATVCNIVLQVISITYLVYAMIVGSGNLWVNLSLLVLSTAYFVFYLIVHTRKKDLQKKVAKIFRWCKLGIKFFNLGLIIYGLYFTLQEVTLLALVQLAFMIVGWVLGVVFEVVISVLEKRATLILDGLKEDFSAVISAVNFFKRMKGEEEWEKPSEKNKSLLSKLKAKREEEKQKKKEERKAQQQAEKDVRKAENQTKTETALTLTEEKPKKGWFGKREK